MLASRSISVVIFEATTTPTNFLSSLSEKDVESVSVTFKFSADAALLTSNYTAVEVAVLPWLADTMGVSAGRILALILTPGTCCTE